MPQHPCQFAVLCLDVSIETTASSHEEILHYRTSGRNCCRECDDVGEDVCVNGVYGAVSTEQAEERRRGRVNGELRVYKDTVLAVDRPKFGLGMLIETEFGFPEMYMIYITI